MVHSLSVSLALSNVRAKTYDGSFKDRILSTPGWLYICFKFIYC